MRINKTNTNTITAPIAIENPFNMKMIPAATKIPAAKNKNLQIYVAKFKNLFRFPGTDWVYFPKIRVLYEKIISGEVKEYYEELKRDMQSKDYKFVENNNYNITHVRLLKKGGNKYFK